MGTRCATVDRFKVVERWLRDGCGVREIARTLKCSRETVREVYDGMRLPPSVRTAAPEPL